MVTKYHLTKSFLLEEYLNKRLSTKKIAAKLGCSWTTVHRKLLTFGIPRYQRHDHCLFDKVLTKEYLVDMYVNKSFSTTEIAKVVGCVADTVRVYLLKFNIVVERTSKYNRILTKTFLEENYTQNVRSAPEIAEVVGCDTRTVRDRLIKLGFTLRDDRRGVYGNTWKGGVTPLNTSIREMAENISWRTSVFERDIYTCQDCQEKGGKLEAHHLKPFSVLLQEFCNYYSQFSPVEDKETLVRLASTWAPFWDVSNGQTLCEKCHDSKKKETHGIIKELVKAQSIEKTGEPGEVILKW